MIKRLKPYLRWLVLGLTTFFLLKTLQSHWQGVLALRWAEQAGASLVMALGVTLAAHIWSGWVWGRLLQGLSAQALPKGWAIATYLRTNLAKYLPGNIWHFYRRLQACRKIGLALPSALLSIVLEPLLMAAAALFVASLSYPGWQTLALLPILIGVHPRFLNPILQRLARGKQAALGLQGGLEGGIGGNNDATIQLQHYPLAPLLGEMGFVLLRSLGFLLALRALEPILWAQIPRLVGAFSLAWVLGLVVPGAPGGMGVFEGAAIALLQNTLPPEIILGAVAVYRLISTLAEVLGAGVSLLGRSDRPPLHPPSGF